MYKYNLRKLFCVILLHPCVSCNQITLLAAEENCGKWHGGEQNAWVNKAAFPSTSHSLSYSAILPQFMCLLYASSVNGKCF